MGSNDFTPRLLPYALDQEALSNPERLFCIHSVSLKSLRSGWRRVTVGDLAHAVNNFAWWLEETVSSSATPERLVYIGPNDIRYAIAVLACMKLGHCLLILSPNTTPSVVDHLLTSGNCSKLLFARELTDQAQDISTSNKNLQTWEVSDLWAMFKGPTRPFPYSDEYTLAREQQPAVVLYSSGTTGLSKEIALPHGHFSAWDYFNHIPLPLGRNTTAPWLSHPNGPHLMKAHMYHGTGLIAWVAALFHQTHFVLGPDVPLTAAMLKAIVSETSAKSGLFAAYMLTNLSTSAEGLEALATLECISFAGLPLPSSVGDKIARVTRLQTCIGMTEQGYLHTIQPRDRKDWEYFEWNSHHPVEMRDHPSGYSELVITRPPGRYTHGVFFVLPDEQEFCTGDLYAQHPEKQGLWKHVGRTAGVSKLQNRVFLHPAPIERALQEHELVSRAVMTPDPALRVVLIVDPDWTMVRELSPEEIIERLWPLVEKLNGGLPEEARMARTRIVIAPVHKPFRTTAKGSVQRRYVLDDFAEEIEADLHNPIPPLSKHKWRRPGASLLQGSPSCTSWVVSLVLFLVYAYGGVVL